MFSMFRKSQPRRLTAARYASQANRSTDKLPRSSIPYDPRAAMGPRGNFGILGVGSRRVP
jgi:hypothetical protein